VRHIRTKSVMLTLKNTGKTMKIFASVCLLCIPALLVGQTAASTHQPSREDASAQTIDDTREDTTSGSIGDGIVVDAVNKNFEGEKAGLQPGDILLRWTRDGASGEMRSPFDLSRVEIEQAPLGSVTVEGLRGTKNESWVLGEASWGIDARPNFSGGLLTIYLDGEQLRKAGNATAAMEHWRSALAKMKMQDAQPDFSTWLLVHAAKAFAAAAQSKEADAAYQEAVETTTGTGSLAKIQALRAWCGTLKQRGEWVNAGKRSQAAAQESLKLEPEGLMFADAFVDLGYSLMREDDLAGAEKIYSQALEIQQRLAPDSLPVARSLRSLGSVALYQGDLIKADDYYHQALMIQERLAPGGMDVAASLDTLGAAAKNRGDLVRAEQLYRQALALGEKLFPDSMFIAATVTNLGGVAEERGDLDQAEEYYRQGLKLWEKLAPGTTLVAASFNYLGTLALDRGARDQAEQYFRQALALEQKEGDDKGVAWTLGNLGMVAQSRGDLDQAEEFYNEALAAQRRVAPDNLEVAEILNNLASVARKRGDSGKAAEYYRQALAIWEKAAPEKQEYGDTLAALATVMVRQGKFDEATPLFEHALTVQENQMSHFGGEENTRSTFRALHAANYQGYVDLLVRQKQPERAFQVLERSRARTLLEVLGSHRAGITKAMTSEEREAEANLQIPLTALNRQLRAEKSSAKPDATRLATLNSDLEKAQLRYSDFQTTLYVAHPELQAQRGQIKPVSLDEAAGLLPDKRCAFLEFMVAEDKTYLFVLAPGSSGDASKPALNVYSIDIQSKDLERETEQFRRQLAQRDLRFGKAATRLYRLLIEPAQALLSHADALLIVPDGPLWNLPFQALQPRPGHYLLEDHALAYASSLTVLREMVRLRLKNGTPQKNDATSGQPSSDSAADQVSQTLLAMGNPILGTATSAVAKLTYRDGTLTPLPDAAREVETLKGVYGRQQSQVFVGRAATEEQFKARAGTFRILHLATHGYLNDGSPMYSHLLLSTGNDKEDGLLQTWEIMNLDLHADLAVLSACETARGRVATGEGVIGLAWAFFVAGVPTTIVSQWSVSSESTAALMIAFHRARKSAEKTADPFGTARALQHAELKLLHNPTYSAPFYWAGFIALGDPR
jgi:CHAT domain-containing protein/Tfp pilus assembly protein PilF